MKRILFAWFALSMTIFSFPLSSFAAPGELAPQTEVQSSIGFPSAFSFQAEETQPTQLRKAATQEDIPSVNPVCDLDGHWAEYFM
ncbi:MAG: hypothetical protein N2Z65_08535, partial [Clostridiales bacterium]|nr:hypothetical protein [Clostridiales bacterium]